jgi:antitoxin (DNA-binding transcriptional repressor) of toxin-antitoxin stability system
MTVGTKQLKNQLSYYLRRVRAGEVVKVTDRGRIVAELRGAVAGRSNEEGLLRELDVAGLVTAGAGRLRDFQPVRLRGRILASAVVSEDRG